MSVNRNPSGPISQPSGYIPNMASLLMLQKWKNSSVLHQLSPRRHSDWTLGVAGSVFFFTVKQLHPAGCVVGVPSVVWKLCLQDTTLPGERRLWDVTHYSAAIWLPSLYHMRLTSFQFRSVLLVLSLMHCPSPDVKRFSLSEWIQKGPELRRK